MSAGQLVIAYHGCDVTLRDDLVSGKVKHLNHSSNKYDWLGSGSYFFENDFQRAILFAKNSSAAPEKMYTEQPIATPAAVGAILCVSRWLDMTTQDGIHDYMNALEPMIKFFNENGQSVPKNRSASVDDKDMILRELDRSVFEFIHQFREGKNELPDFQAVRGAFSQGKKLSDNSGFQENTHVQIALRDNTCVLGWFLPTGLELLSQDKMFLARERLQELKKVKRKPKVRAPV